MDEPKQISDIGKPSANPSGRPIIVSNKPEQSDPMMSKPKPEVPITPVVQAPDHAFTPSNKPEKPAAPAINNQSVAEPVHKFIHQEAFFGDIGKRKRGRKILLFIVLLILFAAAAYGAWTYRKNQDKKVSKSAATAQTTTPTAKETPTVPTPVATPAVKYTYTAPANYLTYTDKTGGFSFSYPKQFGQITKGDGLVDEYSIKVSTYMHSNELTVAQTAIPGLSGQIAAYSYPAKTSEIVSGKYGPQIKLEGDKWVVSKIVNPADKSKVGDAFPDTTGKAPANQKNGSLVVYTIASGDEGTERLRLVIVTDTLHVISLPEFEEGTYGTSTKPTDQTAYRAMVKEITNLVIAL